MQSHSELLRVRTSICEFQGDTIQLEHHPSTVQTAEFCHLSSCSRKGMEALIFIISAFLLLTGSILIRCFLKLSKQSSTVCSKCRYAFYPPRVNEGAYLFNFLDHWSTFSFKIIQYVQWIRNCIWADFFRVQYHMMCILLIFQSSFQIYILNFTLYILPSSCLYLFFLPSTHLRQPPEISRWLISTTPQADRCINALNN